jgi:glutathione peroxidase
MGAKPKWNFHKIIINKEGKIAKSFSSITNPSSKKFLDLIKEEVNK